jgi:hypothetical protein
MANKSKRQGHDKENKSRSYSNSDDLAGSGGRQNASANRGGTSDLDDEALTVDRKKDGRTASGIRTKTEVTGSDFDGQVKPE